MHRISPTIQIDYFDGIDRICSPETWHGYEQKVKQQTVLSGRFSYEKAKVGGGIPPIRTDAGWLFMYHGVGEEKQHNGAAEKHVAIAKVKLSSLLDKLRRNPE